jgi:Skp family chaperone for outer membrane proteins
MKKIVLSLLILSAVFCTVPSFASDNAVVCFPEADAARLLRIVEKDLPDCRAGAAAADEMIRAQEARMDEIRAERDQCAEASKEAAKASEDAVDAAKGSWWDRFKSSATKVGAGVLIGIGIAVLL